MLLEGDGRTSTLCIDCTVYYTRSYDEINVWTILGHVCYRSGDEFLPIRAKIPRLIFLPERIIRVLGLIP